MPVNAFVVCQLNWLSLGINDIGDRGARVLARCLPSCKALRALNLESNRIGQDGQASLKKNLSIKQRLPVIGLELILGIQY